MNFSPSPEQRQLADTVQRFLAQEYSFDARKKIVASEDGWSRPLWGKLAELGLLSLQVPEEHGGMAPAAVESLLTLTAMGRFLVVEPFLSSAIIGTALVRAQASAAQAAALLPALAAGERIVAPALTESGARYDLRQVATAATRSGDGWALRGHKAVVLHAPAADLLLVSARTGAAPAGTTTAPDHDGDEPGISLFAVPRGAAGVRLSPYRTLDGQVAADVTLDGVQLPADALLGAEGSAFAAISAAVDLGVAGICAEAAGTLQAALDATLDYTKTRKQFGVPIARFQALQHRMAEMLIHVEQARSMSFLAALRANSPDAGERRRATSAAKVVIGQACRYVGQQAVQLHGGMGVTDELPVSHAFKRLVAIELSLGDTGHHLERFIAAGR